MIDLGIYPEFAPQNKDLDKAGEDFLFHFGFGTKTMDLPKVFGEIKSLQGTKNAFLFVCAGGSQNRMKLFAETFAKECKLECSENLSKTDRFVLYKTGKVLWVNHGMGCPSLSIMLTEMLKLMYYAKAKDFRFIRLGTCGGLGLEAGVVVVSKNALNHELNEKYTQWVGDKKFERDTYLDEELRNELIATAKEQQIPVETGLTLCCDEFYEGQMRIDSFLREYAPEERYIYLKKAYDKGVRNIEMESACFASMTFRAGVKGKARFGKRYCKDLLVRAQVTRKSLVAFLLIVSTKDTKVNQKRGIPA
ncbi:unnamed protein product [Cylicostephanus goldi]|uniref:Nucleoside phosphorylase domain-containing protein n=1 Tax=Cylicostephanus goldi TaxID=71465 RepID=A0A3P6S4Y9_CYLGO|nr:unnamed protein product [Cylicostephanus goldi]